MTSFRDFIGTARAGLPAAPLARWAAIFFSLSVFTLLISLAASQAMFFAASVFYVVYLLHDRPAVRFLPVKIPLAIFCTTTILAVFWASNTTVGWFAVRKLLLFGIWLLAVNLVVSLVHLRLLFQAVLVQGALAGVVAVYQFVNQYRTVRALHPERLYLDLTSLRIHGFMGHWMNFAGQEMLAYVALVAFLLLSRRAPPASSQSSYGRSGPNSQLPTSYSRFWWLVGVVIAVALVLNFTRGAWLGCFVATIYLVARWRARWLLALPALLAIAFIASPSLVRQRVHMGLHPTEDPSLSIRFEMWSVALRMMRAHPWLGVGPNNIEREYVLYLPAGRAPEVGYHSHFHNDFFQMGAERGLPCLASWVWLMAALGWHFWKLRRRLAPSRWVADAALAAWLALLVEGCFEFNFGTSPVLMVFLFLTATPFVAAQAEVESKVES